MIRHAIEITVHFLSTGWNVSDLARRIRFAAWLWLLVVVAHAASLQAAEKSASPEIPPELANYVNRPEPKSRWELRDKKTVDGTTIYTLNLVSQEWQSVVWEHDLQIFQPAGTVPTATMLLWNQGGKAGDPALGVDLARRVNAPVALLHGIPNQPLFGGKTEDTLIAETFVRYLETRDGTWPLLFPMVKSLVKAMDSLQEFSKNEWNQPLSGFVVSGASKRGWTTWLTAAADSRVKGIVPMVIDTLNMRVQMPYQHKSFGSYSDQIADYTARGLVPMPDTPEAKKLWSMVDPWAYRKRLTIPKLLINGNNDQYWTSDALNLYWDDLQGDKWLLYVPNAGHNLEQQFADGRRPNRERALNALAAFTRHLTKNNPVPRLTWKHDESNGKARLTVEARPQPLAARLWVARAATRDFRQAQFGEQALKVDGAVIVGEVPLPTEGHLSFFAELDYEIDGLPHQLSTQLRIVEPAK